MRLLCLFIISITFSQNIVHQDIFLKNDSIILPGTLSYNKTLKPQPLVIFAHGSGTINRDGNQLPFSTPNYIKQLSEALTNSNIAFYRYDKRNATKANLKFLIKGMSFDELTNDLKIAINQFKDDKRFSSITLIGHSQGSLVAMLATSKYINKFISLAGPAISIDKVLVKQITNQLGTETGKILKNHLEELKQTGTIKNINPTLQGLLHPSNQKFLKTWGEYNPTAELKKLTIPTLIINGTKDLQVTPDDAKLLYESALNAQLKIIDKMNHVLKTIYYNDNNLKSYTSSEFKISQELVNVITEFILQ